MFPGKPTAILFLIVSFLLCAAGPVSAGEAAHIRCFTPFLQEAKVNAAKTATRVSRGGEWNASKRISSMTPPANPNVGDSWNWYIWSLNGPPTATLQSCTVRGEGANCYVVVEDSQWNTNINQAQVDTILARFESHSPGPFPSMGIYDIDTTAFGQPPDELDNDPKIYLLYYNFDVAADGFFWIFDQYPDGTQPYASNECEVIYLNCFGSGDPAGEFMLAVAAHEFEHLIHWNYDEDELSWVDEGLAELAMWMYGNPDNISGFNANPNDPLIDWGSAWTDYIQTYLWTLYFYEQYGGIGSVRKVVEEPRNSVAGYNAVLSDQGYSEQFIDLFGDWTVANFVDDPSLADGRYGYVGETIPPFVAVDHNVYPVGPLNRNVQRTACKYRRFYDGSPMRFYFDGSDDAVWKPKLIFYTGTTPLSVEPLLIDGLNAGEYVLSEFGTTYDSVVVAFPHASVGGSNSFTYGTDFGTDLPLPAPGAARLLQNRPNPFNPTTTITFAVPGSDASASPVRLDIYDVTGRLVRNLVNRSMPSGEHSVIWDGRTVEGVAVGSGVYFYELECSDTRATRQMTLIR